VSDRTFGARQVVTATELQAPPQAVWAHVASLEGINYELGPWIRMTAPRGAELAKSSAQRAAPIVIRR
jgi:hypothetical protein